jgi:N-methylhydantoinase A
METEGKTLVSTCGVALARLSTVIEANVRFSGQSFELPVPVTGALNRDELARIRERFFALYKARYHRLNRDVPVEIVSWRVVIKGPSPKVSIAAARKTARRKKALKGHRKAFMPEAGSFVSCPIYDRYALFEGDRLRGPAIIEEHESTVVVGPNASIKVDKSCNLWVTRSGRQAKKGNKGTNRSWG